MDEDLGDFTSTEAADDVLIGCAQAVEYYEIARYGTLKAWATKLGITEVKSLLDATPKRRRKPTRCSLSLQSRLKAIVRLSYHGALAA